MRDDGRNANPVKRGESRRPLLAVGVLVILAWLIYRPDRLRPFHILDFAEFIPYLEAGTDIVDRTTSLVEYYAGEGRVNLITYALLAVKWDVFGWWSPGWQGARALLMVAVFILAFVLLRRLGASRLGGLVGSSVFLWAPSAADGWVRMTMAEPLGIAIALAMSIRATRFQATQHWTRECVILGVGAVALILTKELLAPVLLLPTILGLAVQPDRTFSVPARSRRNLALLASLAGASAIALVPVAALYFSADSSAYASLYGRGMQTPASILAIWFSGLVPFELIVAPVNVGWVIAFLSLTVLLSAGWRIGFRSDLHRSRASWLLAIALLVPLAGVIAYVPNPWFARFYMLPYLTGAALLTGMGATYLQSTARSAAAIVGLCWIGMSAYAMTSAAELAARTDALQRRDDRLVAFVHDSTDADTIAFATSRPPLPEWVAEASPTGAPRGLGANLRRFAHASHRPWPPTREAGCDDGRNTLARSRDVVVINLEESCELGTEQSHHIVQEFRRFDWSDLRVVTDTSQARVFHRTPSPSR